MASPSKRSIYAALAGNIAVAAVKLVAFVISGSASMLVEAIHSGIDTVNQGLLLLGMRLSARPPDEQHPFGYGMDTFFWTFVVGMLILVAGGVASIYEGIEKLRHPQLIDHLPLTLGVLGVSFVFEAASFLVSWRESERGRPELSRRRFRRVSLAQFIHFSPDPAVFEVLAEGIASILGLILAAAGVIGTAVFGWRFADGAAAVAIGLLLVVLAVSMLLFPAAVTLPTVTKFLPSALLCTSYWKLFSSIEELQAMVASDSVLKRPVKEDNLMGSEPPAATGYLQV